MFTFFHCCGVEIFIVYKGFGTIVVPYKALWHNAMSKKDWVQIIWTQSNENKEMKLAILYANWYQREKFAPKYYVMPTN